MYIKQYSCKTVYASSYCIGNTFCFPALAALALCWLLIGCMLVSAQGQAVEKSTVYPCFEALAALHQAASADGKSLATLAGDIAAQAARTGLACAVLLCRIVTSV